MTSPLIGNVVATRFVSLASAAAIVTGISSILVSLFGIHCPLNLLDSLILLGLASGVYLKKSRTCAIILLACHFGARFYMYQLTGSLYAAFGPVPISIAWIYAFGILGTLALCAKRNEGSATAPNLSANPI